MKAKVRNADKVLSVLSDLPGKPVITKADLVIQVPCRFRDIGLLQLGNKTFVYGLFAIILATGEYAVCNVNALLEVVPSSVEKEMVNDEEYYNLHFSAGDTFIRTKDLVCRAPLVFKAIEEFVFKGKVPWYVDYDTMGKLFDTAEEHTKTRANIQHPVMEFMAAYIGRSKENRIKFIREAAKDYKEYNEKLTWVPMQSVYWSAPGTVNKLVGAYFSDGVVSALVNPSERVEKVEKILRA